MDLTANLPRYTILSRVSFPSAVGGFGIMNIWPRSIKVIPRSMQLNSVFRWGKAPQCRLAYRNNQHSMYLIPRYPLYLGIRSMKQLNSRKIAVPYPPTPVYSECTALQLHNLMVIFISLFTASPSMRFTEFNAIIQVAVVGLGGTKEIELGQLLCYSRHV